MWAVEVQGVVKAFDHRPVLRGVDLRVGTGETVAILGANGSGKTTLLRLIATLSAPTRGTVSLFDRTSSPAPDLRRRIGLVSHESLLYDSLTVEENLRFFAGLYGLPRDRVGSIVAEMALHRLVGRRARVLSRGQRQQVNLARALLHDPDLVILDEPFTGLDLDAAARVTATLRDRTARERTILFTTHDLAEARALASGAVVLMDGRLSPITPPDQLAEAQLAEMFGNARR
jgi:heme exporter protein A